MTQKEVRNRNNMIIGWLQDFGNNVNAIHISKGYSGYYNKQTDITFDKFGKLYAYGNALDSLVRDIDNNK